MEIVAKFGLKNTVIKVFPAFNNKCSDKGFIFENIMSSICWIVLVDGIDKNSIFFRY